MKIKQLKEKWRIILTRFKFRMFIFATEYLRTCSPPMHRTNQSVRPISICPIFLLANCHTFSMRCSLKKISSLWFLIYTTPNGWNVEPTSVGLATRNVEEVANNNATYFNSFGIQQLFSVKIIITGSDKLYSDNYKDCMRQRWKHILI